MLGTMRFIFLFLTATFILFSSNTFAHTVEGGGFFSGITHPVLGFDHLLAMISVGIVSTQMGGKAVWTVPTTFVVVMAVGATIGILNIPLPYVEKMIVFSVIALGISIAFAQRMSIWVGMLFVGIFATFHGHAHGTEMPYLANPWLYAVGFTLGTAGIHLFGVGIGIIAHKNEKFETILRYSGAFISGMGMQMLIGQIS